MKIVTNMVTDTENAYELIRSGKAGFYEQKRGLISVRGKEARKFLDGLITNDVKTLDGGTSMLAAFPNAQGRLLAVVRVRGFDDIFFIETEEATREKVFQNLFRFTFAGDFFVTDISENFRYFEIFNSDTPMRATGMTFISPASSGRFEEAWQAEGGAFGIEIDDNTYETIRIESGIPKYGVDMDETTIVPELGLDGLISYNKGCYIGQEIIARIHFRGHVAKRLAGLISDQEVTAGAELSIDGKNAGRVTSVTFSPKLNKHIALGYVRYDHLAPGTSLTANDHEVTVAELPLI